MCLCPVALSQSIHRLDQAILDWNGYHFSSTYFGLALINFVNVACVLDDHGLLADHEVVIVVYHSLFFFLINFILARIYLSLLNRTIDRFVKSAAPFNHRPDQFR